MPVCCLSAYALYLRAVRGNLAEIAQANPTLFFQMAGEGSRQAGPSSLFLSRSIFLFPSFGAVRGGRGEKNSVYSAGTSHHKFHFSLPLLLLFSYYVACSQLVTVSYQKRPPPSFPSSPPESAVFFHAEEESSQFQNPSLFSPSHGIFLPQTSFFSSSLPLSYPYTLISLTEPQT